MFHRKSMEELVNQMMSWAKGASSKVTDFRVGSIIRTLYEAVGRVVEDFYDKVYKETKKTIEQNLYTILGFSKRPATYATGEVTFSRVDPASTDYLIPAGTQIRTKATQTKSPVVFRTTEDALLSSGSTSTTAPVICEQAGTDGNISSGAITDFITKPSGVDSVTNTSSFTNGQNEETLDEQKVRFRKYIDSLKRGTIASVEYGAITSELIDANGDVTERVITARAFEDLVNRKGEIDVYVWNGFGNASANLISEVEKTLQGYYDSEGKAVYGYKPAGIITNVYTATMKEITIQLDLELEPNYILKDVSPYIEEAIDGYFLEMELGSTLVQTELETRINLVDGVYDVKANLSVDGGTSYTQNNISSQATEILKAGKPINYNLIGA